MNLKDIICQNCCEALRFHEDLNNVYYCAAMCTIIKSINGQKIDYYDISLNCYWVTSRPDQTKIYYKNVFEPLFELKQIINFPIIDNIIQVRAFIEKILNLRAFV